MQYSPQESTIENNPRRPKALGSFENKEHGKRKTSFSHGTDCELKSHRLSKHKQRHEKRVEKRNASAIISTDHMLPADQTVAPQRWAVASLQRCGTCSCEAVAGGGGLPKRQSEREED